MAKLKGQLFARLALDYFDHPKIAGLSDAAIVAHLRMIVYARRYETDGVVPGRVARGIAYETYTERTTDRSTDRDTERTRNESLSPLDELLNNDSDSPSLTMLDDGSYMIHGYADMQETKAEIQQRSRSARKSINARWGKDTERTTDRSSERSTERSTKRSSERNTDRNTETETETDKQIKTRATRTKQVAIPDGFEVFWDHYGRKDGRARAIPAFAKALESATAEELIQAAKNHAEHHRRVGTESRFIPMPATWLNQERWLEDSAKPPTVIPQLEEWQRYA